MCMRAFVSIYICTVFHKKSITWLLLPHLEFTTKYFDRARGVLIHRQNYSMPILIKFSLKNVDLFDRVCLIRFLGFWIFFMLPRDLDSLLADRHIQFTCVWILMLHTCSSTVWVVGLWYGHKDLQIGSIAARRLLQVAAPLHRIWRCCSFAGSSGW